ncbi:MAG: hypothetical protein AB7O88_23425 [Reyranellaceae bacterium]
MSAPLDCHGPRTGVLPRAMALAIALATLVGAAAHATWPIPEQACAKLWTKADANRDGVVMGAEAKPYLAAARHDGRVVPDDGRIGRVTFMEQCRVGVYARPPHKDGASPKPAEASRPDVKPLPRPWGLP